MVNDLPDDLKLAIDLFKDSNATVNTLWSLYIVVSAALAGYVLASKDRIPALRKFGLAIIFVIFFLGNADALKRAQAVGYAAAQAISEIRQEKDNGLRPSVNAMLSKLDTYEPTKVVHYQYGISGIILAAIIIRGIYEARHKP